MDTSACLVHGVRYERALVRANRAHKTHQVVEGIAFDVELCAREVAQQCREVMHVAGANMALVRPRMDGNTRRARLQGNYRRARDTRNREPTRVSQ